jgi:hypothetical protein
MLGIPREEVCLWAGQNPFRETFPVEFSGYLESFGKVPACVLIWTLYHFVVDAVARLRVNVIDLLENGKILDVVRSLLDCASNHHAAQRWARVEGC